MKFNTNAIHEGQVPDKETGAVIPPIYMTSTYAQESPGNFKGYDYTRAGNPNFTNAETTLAALEKGAHATLFSSGLGATTALITATLKQGDTVVACNDLYGGTYRLFTKVFAPFGINFVAVDTQDLDAYEQALKEHNPAMVFVESPTNPLLRTNDIKTLTEKTDALVVADNTFSSPYYQNPLEWGVDVVLHSCTKYLGGHSDFIGGVLVTNNDDLKKKFDFARMAVGVNPSPFDAWMLSRSLKTLGLRMERHTENAKKVAEFLESHDKVSKVYYPGFSGIVSVEFDMSLEDTEKLISSFSVFTLAESLGGVESLVDHPASMTHASIPKEEREKAGLKDGLVRFSVGIEDSEDIIADLENALG